MAGDDSKTPTPPTQKAEDKKPAAPDVVPCAPDKTAASTPDPSPKADGTATSGAEKVAHSPTPLSSTPPPLPNFLHILRKRGLFSYATVTRRALETSRTHLNVFLRPEGRAMRLVAATVLLPGLIVFLYLAFWASGMYISETKFAIRGQNAAPSLDSLSSLFRISTSTQSDSYIVLNYITSLDMLNKLDAGLQVRAHYADQIHDIWFRLRRHASQGEMLSYWQWATAASYDPDTAILSVAVKAFSPEMARKICRGILENSEALVNTMNERAREDAIAQARLEVSRAEERIRAAQEALRDYRESTIILDPQAVAAGLYGVVNRLEGEVTATTAELAEVLTFMQHTSPRVVQLRNRLEVLQKQLEAEKKRLAGGRKRDTPLSALISEFQSLTLEEEFARKQLTSAMASLETARVQADAQTLYIEPFEQPTLPDESLYPRPVFFTCIFMVTALLLLGLISLIIAAVHEHAGF